MGKASTLLQAFFLFPEAAVGNKQAGGGRGGVGAAARDARVLWKGSGLVMAGCRALRPGLRRCCCCRPHPHPPQVLHYCHRPGDIRPQEPVAVTPIAAGDKCLPSAHRPKKRIPGSIDGNAFN